MAVITAEQLSKKYIIGHQRQGNYVALRDVLAHTARGVWQRVRHPLSPNRENIESEEIWALRDVNFEIRQGERMGIIGRNGAGKSTLLKILSRITHPTTGRVHIKGRVASLLEVGTGFHPELTGRENIYLNGAILGMTRQEIKSRFDEIVAFAEIEKFLDTPVKRYSSGMYVRLAFAVAAHLEPEILLVDEVLAVGDVAFQKKCLGKMGEVSKEGRTVLFVSHNMSAIKRLCPQCILLEHGVIDKTGPTDQVIFRYLKKHLTAHDQGVVDLTNVPRSSGTQKGAIKKVWIEDDVGNIITKFPMGAKIRWCFLFESQTMLFKPAYGISVSDNYGNQIFAGGSISAKKDNNDSEPVQSGIAVFEYDVFPVAPGIYNASFGLDDANNTIDLVENVMQFEVTENNYFENDKMYLGRYGMVFVENKVYVRERKVGEKIMIGKKSL